MTTTKPKTVKIKESSQPLRKQQKPLQSNNKQKSHKYPKPNIKLIIIAFFTGISLSIALQRYIGHNWQQFASQIFSINTITDQTQKLTLLKQSMTLMATLQLLITMIVMSIRVFGQKISPVGEKDPLIIAVLNRILNNNIEQFIVFFSLYAYLLLSPQIHLSNDQIFALPLLFMIGRVLYFFSYLVGSMFNVSSTRTLGFAFIFGLGYLMIVELILEQTTFMRSFLFL